MGPSPGLCLSPILLICQILSKLQSSQDTLLMLIALLWPQKEWYPSSLKLYQHRLEVYRRWCAEWGPFCLFDVHHEIHRFFCFFCGRSVICRYLSFTVFGLFFLQFLNLFCLRFRIGLSFRTLSISLIMNALCLVLILRVGTWCGSSLFCAAVLLSPCHHAVFVS